MNLPKTIKIVFFLLAIPFANARDAYLSYGDEPLFWMPEADFAGELQRMKLPPMPFTFTPSDLSQAEEAARADQSDLEAALRNTPIHEREMLVEAYLTERRKITDFRTNFRAWEHRSAWDDASETEPPQLPVILFPSQIPLEFRLYLEGTEALHAGSKTLARAKWQELLSLPRSERKFRSTWAAYMIAKSWLKEDALKAKDHLKLVRTLAKNGYRDSLSLAASTYGWEGRAELNLGNYIKALEHYLEAYRAGDPAAVESFKVVIADILLNHDELLPVLAQHEFLRRVLTAHLISGFWQWNTHYSAVEASESRSQPWLRIMASQPIKSPDLLEQLALAACQSEDWLLAEHWLKAAPKGSLLIQWLQAKVHLKKAETGKAIAILSRIAPSFPFPPEQSQAPNSLLENIELTRGPGRHVRTQIHGELAMLLMARRDYTQALEIFLENDLERDAKYIGERVLKTSELQNFVDSYYPAQPDLSPGEMSEAHRQIWQRTAFIRRLTACRLARESQFSAARPYYDQNELLVLDQFLTFKRVAEDETQPTAERATNYWQAATLIREQGAILFDSPLEPWWRRSANYHEPGMWPLESGGKPLVTAASEDELQRAESHKPRSHFFELKFLAADFAWKAAELLPDNSEETARILHTAGAWIKYIDPEAADKFYKALVLRCRETELGWAADIKRWFPQLDHEGKIVYPLRAGADEEELFPLLEETPPYTEEPLEYEDDIAE